MADSEQSMPWIEKYRPTQFDDIVLDPLNRIFFQNIIEKSHFPNLLFYGPPGTGKTTTIINLINEYQTRYTRKNRESVIHLNASDERGIDIIRNQIYQFVRSNHIFESGYKFVILDEVDYMTKNAQQALKTLLQTCRANVRFCLICNYISKIDESLQQEFICVRFNQLPSDEIKCFVMKIAEEEKLSLSSDDIDIIQETYQSDIRSMINFLQLSSMRQSNIEIVRMSEWDNLHRMLSSSEVELSTLFRYLSTLSETHNMHKKQIILNYMSYVIRKHVDLINDELLSIFEEIAHINDDIQIYDLVHFFIANVSSLYRQDSGLY